MWPKCPRRPASVLPARSAGAERLRSWGVDEGGDQGAKVIRASGVTTILDHGVEARSAQTGKLFKRFQNEGPVKVDRRCAVDLFERRQAGLGEDTRHTVAVESQLAGEGADRPAFSVVVTQDRGFSFWGEGHVCSGEVDFGESDSAGSPGVPCPARGDGNDSTTRAPE